MITNDAVILGILFLVLFGVLRAAQSSQARVQKFFRFVPPLMLCYFIPALLNTLGIIGGQDSKLYSVASKFFLPACLVLLSVAVDIRGVFRLGPKALLVFLSGSVGVVLGGPVALLVCKHWAPGALAGVDQDQLWKGLSTIAGSWIGGGANQAAMKEIFQVSDAVFSSMVAVDILVADVWMALLLFSVSFAAVIDRWNRADTRAIAALTASMEGFQKSVTRVPTTLDYFWLCSVAFGVAAFGHWAGDALGPWIKEHAPHLARYGLASGFFWMISIATFVAIMLSFTRARELEGVGASKIAHLFIMFLVTTIGMHMDILAIFRSPGLFLIGAVWMLVHITVMTITAWLLKAPFFFVAVGSQANIGGAASAPIVASAFHPALAPVGALLAILGYAVGTYFAWVSALIMQAVLSAT